MENENVELETSNESVEETVETPVVLDTEDTPAASEVDVEQLQATNKKLYERAKKAEADLKAYKTSSPAPTSKQASPASVEETVLLAQGMSEELLNELKAVAKARGIASLIKAQNDYLFVAAKEKFEKDKKAKDSSMPASRGAGQVKAQKTFSTPGLTKEEHMKMVKNLS